MIIVAFILALFFILVINIICRTYLKDIEELERRILELEKRIQENKKFIMDVDIDLMGKINAVIEHLDKRGCKCFIESEVSEVACKGKKKGGGRKK